MKGKFCPKCGSTDKTFYNGFCIDCFVKDHPGLVEITDIVLKQCSVCLRIRSGVGWETGTHKNIEEAIASKVKTSIQNPVIKVELVNEKPKSNEYEVTVSGLLDENPVELILPAVVKFEKEVCDVCSRKSGNYYEAIMQLRPRGQHIDLDRLKSALNFLRNETRALVKKDRQAEIFRFEQVKNGIDVYFGSARAAKIALQHLQTTYHPVVKESYTLKGVNRETGKNRYSVTYSVRL